MYKPMRRAAQAGFTLIEISIVLIIIGLLLGGVLKGQTMVKNSKIKRIAADGQAFVSATNAYLDSYWALPGDDANTVARWGVTAGNGGGTIGPGAASNTAIFYPALANLATAENSLAVGHLRCSALLKGNCAIPAAISDLPKNAVGGYIGIDDGNSPEDTMLGFATKVICQNNIESDYAMVYDTQFDDGVPGTGDIRGSTAVTYATADATAAAYAAGNTYYVCASF
ncbi:MAG: prepilin-type N-terminal cleavage/methylation domain-containing protein [Magnetococcales bacterium]|nr:prepilin-type N-terminal cleavage/methylation domain-containing protein [Magnetococcales bacterium]